MKIKKINAAKAQIKTAINLFFEEGDPVSVCTLTFAALGILHDYISDPAIAQDSNLIFHYHSIYIKDGFEKKWVGHFRRNSNFFKHADKDLRNGKESIYYNADENHWILYDAIQQLRVIEKNSFYITPEFHVYFIWLSLRYPHAVIKEKKQFIEKLKETLRPEMLNEFKNLIIFFNNYPDFIFKK